MIQGRAMRALFHFCIAGALWLIALGWLAHIWSAFDAARFEPRE